MPKKTTYSADNVVKVAFELVRENGLAGLTAPAVADKMGCSTMPIYSQFKNIQALKDKVVENCWKLVMRYQTERYTGDVWVDQAIGWVRFARDEENLFNSMLSNNNHKLHYKLQMKHWEYLTELVEDYDGFKDLDEVLSQRIRSAHAKLTHGLAMSAKIGPDKIIVEDDKILFRYLTNASQALLIGFKKLPPLDESYKKYVMDKIIAFRESKR